MSEPNRLGGAWTEERGSLRLSDEGRRRLQEPRRRAEDTVAEVMDSFNAAWNDHDLAAAIALTSEDCAFEATSPAPDGQRCVGHEALRAAWQPIFDDVTSHFTVEDSFTAGSRVVQRWRYDWAGGHVRGVDVLTVSGGKVTEKLAYVKG